MFNKRHLNDDEIKYIAKQVSSTRYLLLAVFIVLVVVIAGLAMLVYSEFDEYNIGINLMFGILIILLYILNNYVRGYSKHKVKPEVYSMYGLYERIFIGQGKYGKYQDTLNGHYVKLPWHWREYLSSIKEPVEFEYILRDDVVGVSQGAKMYVVSVNNELSLDYEIKHGLEKAKPLSFINITSLFLILPIVLFLTADGGFSNLLRINELFKSETEPVIASTVDELTALNSSNYVELRDVWVYQFKRPFDYSGNYAVISKEERDRIYYHPDANTSYRYYFSPRMIEKPDREAFEKNLKQSPLYDKGIFKNLNDDLWKKGVDQAFDRALKQYENRLYKAERLQRILEELAPKTILLGLSDDCIDVSKDKVYTVKNGLETPITVKGFYQHDQERIVGLETQELNRRRLKNNLTPVIVSLSILVIALLTIAKIIRDYLLKKRLVNRQLDINTGDPRLNKKN